MIALFKCGNKYINNSEKVTKINSLFFLCKLLAMAKTRELSVSNRVVRENIKSKAQMCLILSVLFRISRDENAIRVV